jgi:ribokinase
MFNPAPAEGVTPDVLSLTDILTPNRGEAASLLAGEGRPDALAADLLGALAGGGHVLITLGEKGASLHGQTGATTIPAPTVTAVDSVGAGDTLNGALAAGLAAGLDLETAGWRAVTAATLAVTRAGAREGMPTAAELAAALAATIRD